MGLANEKQSSESKHLYAAEYEPFIKYMGSKAKILDYVISGINEVYTGGSICDLFSGSSCLAGSLRDQAPIIANDIQNYSSILADSYLNSRVNSETPSATDILEKAETIVQKIKIPDSLEYKNVDSLKIYNEIELKNRALFNADFKHSHHLFLKNYSGTWWSATQCLWIDAIRQVAEVYNKTPVYNVILAALMHAASYCSQGTGHFAQYRDAKSVSSLKDILIYRQRSLTDYFTRKYNAVLKRLPTQPPLFKNVITSLDYKDCLSQIPQYSTVYADPPYCFVHYSRFYHALETLVKYDYPQIQTKSNKIVKGRYRENRHQSPFSIRSQVTDAFRALFSGVKESKSNCVLSYSNTGMITLEELSAIAYETMGIDYLIEILTQDHKHMTMGRKNDRSRDVKECLVLFKRK